MIIVLHHPNVHTAQPHCSRDPMPGSASGQGLLWSANLYPPLLTCCSAVSDVHTKTYQGLARSLKSVPGHEFRPYHGTITDVVWLPRLYNVTSTLAYPVDNFRSVQSLQLLTVQLGDYLLHQFRTVIGPIVFSLMERCRCMGKLISRARFRATILFPSTDKS
jgi:hypothetical protein